MVVGNRLLMFSVSRINILNPGIKKTFSSSRNVLWNPVGGRASPIRSIATAYFQKPILSPIFHHRGQCSDCQKRHNSSSNGSQMMLMDIPRLLSVNPLKALRNMFFTILIRGYYDDSFNQSTFLNGVRQAVSVVSSLLSKGKFDELVGLVSDEALYEVERNYSKLSSQQKQALSLSEEDFIQCFIHEIGMIFDDKTGKRFVEIMTVITAMRAADRKDINLGNAGNKIMVCNYRLIKDFTKGQEGSWIINQLNHFYLKDVYSRN